MATRIDPEKREITAPTEESPVTAEVKELRIDPSVVRVLVRRRWRAWGGVALSGFLGIGLYCFFGLPQNYTARTSLSIQRDEATVSSPLARFAGLGGGGNKSYLGVLRSRSFAERVERRVNLRALYGLKTTEEAVERIQKGLGVEESLTDGLTYIDVTLPAPPRLSPDPGGLRDRVRRMTAEIANAYTVELRRYLKESDTSREAVIQRQAEGALNRARQEYQAALSRLVAFVRNQETGRVLPFAGGSPAERAGAGAAQSVAAGDEIRSLYLERARLQQQITAMDAEKAAMARILRGPEQQMEQIPDEDPLLTQARADVNSAQARLDRLRVSLAETHPDVVAARQQLDQARRRLKEKVNALLSGRSSDTVKRAALRASLEVVEQQIADAARKYQSGQERATDFERLKNEVNLALKVYETAAQRHAEIALTTASAQNRMIVVDEARPPLYGKPGMATMLVMSAFIPLLCVGVWFVVEYVLLTTQQPALTAPGFAERATESNGR
ncbi:MAG: hypothetical protein RMJ43_10615 [Chloroherpetonaceae bacterium]|nr:hypothetical protein [Chthonomonadaceae bacterium]MDW8208282.1 hypothetical protein [Chloroherpetonaceae bacterium]